MGATPTRPRKRNGTRTTFDSDSNPLAAGNVYKITTDGVVTYNTVQGSSAQIVNFLSDTLNPPITVIQHDHGDWGSASISHNVDVVRNEYWKITVAGGASIENLRWLPTGNGKCIKQ